MRKFYIRLKKKVGWQLMGIPWLTHESMHRGFANKNWHARIYLLGVRWYTSE